MSICILLLTVVNSNQGAIVGRVIMSMLESVQKHESKGWRNRIRLPQSPPSLANLVKTRSDVGGCQRPESPQKELQSSICVACN